MFGLCFRFGSAVPLYQLFGVLPALAVHGFQTLFSLVRVDMPSVLSGAMTHPVPACSILRAPHTAKAAPQARTSGACGAAFCIYETEENAQRSAPLERMTF